MGLAHLYLITGNLDESNKLCQNVLRSHPGNDQATLVHLPCPHTFRSLMKSGWQMMADLMYQRNQTESAMFHFQHLLDRNPSEGKRTGVGSAREGREVGLKTSTTRWPGWWS